MSFINIITGNPILTINSKTKRYNASGTIIIGNLFSKKMIKGNHKKEIDDYFSGDRVFLKPVVQTGSFYSKEYLEKVINVENLHVLSNTDGPYNYGQSSTIDGVKIIGLTGLDSEKMEEVAKAEGSCDILVANKMIDSRGDLVFNNGLYEAIGIMKPSLIVMGCGRRSRFFKFPVFDIPCLAFGIEDYMMYDPKKKKLLKEAFDYDKYE